MKTSRPSRSAQRNSSASFLQQSGAAASQLQCEALSRVERNLLAVRLYYVSMRHLLPTTKTSTSGRTAMRQALVLCCSVALLGSVGTANAQDWTKSKWGPNDEIGAANYMTPELVLKAAQLVKTGKTYALGIPVDSKTPAYPPRTFKVTIVQPGQAGSSGLGPTKTTYNDDILDTWVGI